MVWDIEEREEIKILLKEILCKCLGCKETEIKNLCLCGCSICCECIEKRVRDGKCEHDDKL